MFKAPSKALSGNFYNDGIGGLGDTGDMRAAMIRANLAGCGCARKRQPAPVTLGSWFTDLLSSAGSGALSIVKSAGAGEAATKLEEQRIAAAAAAQAAAAPKSSGLSTNTMLLAGAGVVGVLALVMITRKKG